MAWLQVVGTLLAFAFEIFKLWRDKDAERIKIKKEALREGVDAIGNSDISALNRAIERMR